MRFPKNPPSGSLPQIPPKRSYGTVKIKSLNRNKVLRKLKHVARGIIKENPKVMEVSLIGSLAKGNYTGRSDADILIVLKEDSRRFIDRIPRYLSSFLYADIPVDVFPYTEEELKQLRKENSFVKRILDEKIILVRRYDKVERVIDKNEDSVIYYELCPRCWTRIERIGIRKKVMLADVIVV